MRIEIFEIPNGEGGGFCAQDMETLYRGDGETVLDAVNDLLDLQVEMSRQEKKPPNRRSCRCGCTAYLSVRLM